MIPKRVGTCFLNKKLNTHTHTHTHTPTHSEDTCIRVCMLSCFSRVQLCVTLWAVACQEPLSMGFSRQEYWSGFPCPPPGGLPDTGINPESLRSPALAGVKIYSTGPTGKTFKATQTQLLTSLRGSAMV